MRKPFILVAAILLAYVSPWLNSPDHGIALQMWFNLLPTLAVRSAETSSPWVALFVDVGALTVQYLALFGVIAPYAPSGNHRSRLPHGVQAPAQARGIADSHKLNAKRKGRWLRPFTAAQSASFGPVLASACVACRSVS